jgi:hypothetical protein
MAIVRDFPQLSERSRRLNCSRSAPFRFDQTIPIEVRSAGLRELTADGSRRAFLRYRDVAAIRTYRRRPVPLTGPVPSDRRVEPADDIVTIVA